VSASLSIPAAAPRIDLLRAVTVIALSTLPFMTALTINVGFPLKIYEVALLAAAVIVPFAGRLAVPARVVPAILITLAWMVLAGIFLWVRLLFPLPTVSEAGLATRFGPPGDGVTKFIYLMLDLFAFILFARFAARDEDQFIKYWMVGACIAALYSFYLFGMNLVGIEEPPVLPGGVRTQVLIAGRLFIRCATFREGNEAGLYFVVSALLALRSGRRKTAWLLLGAVVTTFSTLALIALLGVLTREFWRRFQTFSFNVKILIAPFMLAFAIGIGGAIVATAVFQTAVVGKLSSEESANALSRIERLAFAKAAVDMFVDHPVMGVGIAQFGYNFSHYSPYPVLGKPIPNVIYLEFLSEDGIIVSLIFAIFFYKTYRKTRGSPYLQMAFLCLVLGFFAYSTISVMFIWALFGLICGREPQLAAPPVGASLPASV
jgi:O-antigen ligase